MNITSMQASECHLHVFLLASQLYVLHSPPDPPKRWIELFSHMRDVKSEHSNCCSFQTPRKDSEFTLLIANI